MIKNLLKDMSAYLEKSKEEPRQKDILEASQRISFYTVQTQKQIEQNFTIVKAILVTLFPPINTH